MTWLTVNKTAKLLNVTESAVKKALGAGKYDYRRVNGVGRGGKQLQIALESLPQAAQDHYNHVEREPEDILHYTGKQREEANNKAWIVVQYLQSGLPPDDFVQRFNAENPPEDAITDSKLFRWQQKYKNREVAALIDRRGGYNRGRTNIPDDAWNCFYALYMTQQERSIQLCYDLIKPQFPGIPSVSAFKRKARQIPEYALLYYRKGPKAAKDKLPSMERSKLDIESNSIWFSDHHKVDVFTKSADGQRIVRPWLTVFFDARSNRVVSHVLREAAPNSTVVKKCFRIGVEENGVPGAVYFDNGADYRSKYFSRDYPMSLVNQLHIGNIYANPYHGQAETVERFFGTFTDRFSRRFTTYTGADAKNRPECMRISNKEILAVAPSMEDFIKAVEAYIEEYNNTLSNGIDMGGKCPDQVYFENLKTKRVISDHDALRLLCGTSEERTVQKNGVSIKNNHYFHEKLLMHMGKRVVVVYDPENIDKISVFDTENRAICVAEARIRTPLRHTTEEDYNRAAKERKAAKNIYKQYKPVRDMDLHSIISRNHLLETQFKESRDTNLAEHAIPDVIQNSAILKNTDQPISSRRIREEDSVSATLMKVYQKQA